MAAQSDTQAVTVVNVPPSIVSLTISGPNWVFENSGAQYTCTALYSDGSEVDVTNSATWSENTSYTSIDNTGYLTTGSVGADSPSTITATYGGQSDTQAVTVVNVPPPSLVSLTISGPSQVNENSGAQYTCTAHYSDGSDVDVTDSANWSENTSYTSINSTGYLTTGSVGANLPSTITATYGGQSDTHTVTVINVPPSVVSLTISGPTQINEGTDAQYTCTALYNNGSVVNVTNSATWSENTSFTSISSTGHLTTSLVSSNRACTITATYGGQSDTQAVTVVNVPLIRQTFEGYSSDGYEYITTNPPVDFPGLAGFKLDFASDDRHIAYIGAGYNYGVLPSGLTGWRTAVSYADDSFNDPFNYAINRVGLPPGTTIYHVSGTDEYGFGFNRVIRPAGFVGVPVLVGFDLYDLYSGSDHHMDRIRVRLFKDQFGQLELGINFQDKSARTEYIYSVAYALVPAGGVITSGVLTGTDGGGSDTAALNANQPVLQGFELDFDTDDHHLDQIGVRLDPGGAITWYNDNNDDDDFSWTIWWVDLN